MVTHPYMIAVLHVGMIVRVACCFLIYRNALRLRFTSLGDKSAGNVKNVSIIIEDVSNATLFYSLFFAKGI